MQEHLSETYSDISLIIRSQVVNIVPRQNAALFPFAVFNKSELSLISCKCFQRAATSPTSYTHRTLLHRQYVYAFGVQCTRICLLVKFKCLRLRSALGVWEEAESFRLS